MDKESAKTKIKELVSEFFKYSKEEVDKKSENQIKSEFIDPLFEALGWDMKKDAEREERVLKGRADYILKLKNQSVLVIEAKKTSVALTPEEGTQAVSYAYNNKIKFAVLTNFRQVRVYHALSNIRNINKNLLKFNKEWMIIPIEKFDEYFDRLWLLSKESFLKKEINKLLSSKDERLLKPVDQRLLNDLIKIRESLSKDIKTKKNYLSKEQIDEIVQILIDRLIFIRSAEDRSLEPKEFLLKLVSDVRTQSVKYQLFPYLLEKFKDFNSKYDSRLFENGLLEKEGAFSDVVLMKSIKALYYGTDDNEMSKYMFDEIPSDILGSIYEQYLGHILSESDKRVKMESGSGKRKSMGIYYTPTYIVDYIVKNTVSDYLRGKTIDEILNVKIVDPACGSGSFIIRAFIEVCNAIENRLNKGEYSNERLLFKSYKERLSLSQKAVILTQCIFGVDLDEKAVELARLSLLLTLLEGEGEGTKKLLLPHLENNIKCGNSLIENPEFDKAFNWKAQFPEAFKNNGFDIVIGNPPYVRADSGEEYLKFRKYMSANKEYETLWEKWDLYIPFIERGIKILNKNGVLGFIIPDSYSTSKYAQKSIKWLIDNKNIEQIDFFENVHIFKGVGVENVLLFIKNSHKTDFLTRRILHKDEFDNVTNLESLNGINYPNELFRKDKRFDDKKLLKDSVSLGDICYISKGMVLNSDESSEKGKWKKEDLIQDTKDKIHTEPYVEAKNIGRYEIRKIRYLEWNTDRVPSKLSRPTFPELYKAPKIMRGRMCDATLDLNGLKTNDSIYNIVRFIDLKDIDNTSIKNVITKYTSMKNREEVEKLSEKFNLKYLLGIINSSLAKKFMNDIRRSRLSIYPEDLRQLPIKIPKEKEEISKLVIKVLELKEHFNKDVVGIEKERLEQQIKNLEFEIDELVYEIYGITNEEKRIIGESLK